MAIETLTYSEDAKGWTSFYNYEPDMFCKLNNRFFTIKDGQLWLHNDKDNPIRNKFYGSAKTSKIVTVINDNNADDKVFKTLELEGTHAWETAVKTNLSNGTIKASEYTQRESNFYAYIRKNEDSADLHGLSAQGIGVITVVAGTNITFAELPTLLNVGDNLYQLNGSMQQQIGIITNIVGSVITVTTIVTTPVVGYFCFAKKEARIEGGDLRGYYAEVTLTNSSTDAVELFGVDCNIIKSGV